MVHQYDICIYPDILRDPRNPQKHKENQQTNEQNPQGPTFGGTAGALRAPAVDFVHLFVDFLCVFADFLDLGGYPDICIYHIGAPPGTNDPFLCSCQVGYFGTSSYMRKRVRRLIKAPLIRK